MAAQQITATTEDVNNELCELYRLSAAIGPSASWAALRTTVIKLDNMRRRIERENPTITQLAQRGTVPPDWL
jgi:hypothetical protein